MVEPGSLRGHKILLCVCGGIAAYKSAELVRRLRDAGAQVTVAMTHNAQHFVGAVLRSDMDGDLAREVHHPRE